MSICVSVSVYTCVRMRVCEGGGGPASAYASACNAFHPFVHVLECVCAWLVSTAGLSFFLY